MNNMCDIENSQLLWVAALIRYIKGQWEQVWYRVICCFKGNSQWHTDISDSQSCSYYSENYGLSFYKPISFKLISTITPKLITV